MSDRLDHAMGESAPASESAFDDNRPELTEEEELEAAKMMRIAQRAELRAAEKKLLSQTQQQQLSRTDGGESGGRPQDLTALPLQQPRFVSLKERKQVHEDEDAQLQPEIQPKPRPTKASIPTNSSGNNKTVPQKNGGDLRSKGNASSSITTTKANGTTTSRAGSSQNGKNDMGKFKPYETSGKRVSKRFKFEWDTAEDTMAGVDVDADLLRPLAHSSKPNNNPSDDLLKLADLRSSRASTDSNGIANSKREPYKDPSTKPLQEMTERDWRIFRENFDIRIRGGACPHPARSWEEMSFPEHLRKVIQQVGYVKPTPIQMQAIPIGFGSSDMVGVAETGSGKTCAFVMPLLVRLSQQPWAQMRLKCNEEGPLALILGPTRELVVQIYEEVQKLGSLGPFPVRSCAVIGGVSAEDQGFRIQEGCDVVVATPGRMIDLLSSRVAVLNQCTYIVLDEADKMVDMGFEPQVSKILESLVVPLESRTTFLFSATMPPSVISLAQRFMRPSRIIVRIGDEESSKNKNIEQIVHLIANESQKEKELLRILSHNAVPPIIIFCNSKNGCDLLVRELRYHGKKAVALHGGRNQEEREENFRKFKEGYHDMLVATDVAGRGLDVEGVTHVINYDCPTALDRYCHRIGRTGRAGKRGKASTIVVKSSDDPSVVNQIAQYMKETGQQITPELKSFVSEFDLSAESLIQE